MSSTDAAAVSAGATLDVISPTSDSMAVAGEEYTVEVGWINWHGAFKNYQLPQDIQNRKISY